MRTSLYCLIFCFLLLRVTESFSQPARVEFGNLIPLENLTSTSGKNEIPLSWIDVNTSPETWTRKGDELVCTGHPIGVMRSEKQYENFILHVEWKHIEPGVNSGVFVWSQAIPKDESRLSHGAQ